MPNDPAPNKYDLEERTYIFARDVRRFLQTIPRTIESTEDRKQAVRSSGSVGANYREANDAISKRDFIHRIKICRKEAKETVYWLRLTEDYVSDITKTELDRLLNEAKELVLIFASILRKCGAI